MSQSTEMMVREGSNGAGWTKGSPDSRCGLSRPRDQKWFHWDL